jgi:hypothetical protein
MTCVFGYIPYNPGLLRTLIGQSRVVYEIRSSFGMIPISLQSMVRVVKDQVSCNLGGETVILSLKNGVYYSLNPVGVRIWNLIAEPTVVLKVRDTLMSEFEVEPGRCEDELLALLQDLANEGLIEVVP